jgi:SAM-dependent methyltransferase
MDTEYRKHYRKLFDQHWWWRARTEFIMATLQRFLKDLGPASILDVGCGDGLLFERLTRLGSVEGIDIEAALQPQSKWRSQIYCGSFDQTFRPSKKYSVILMLDVLEHLADPMAALKNVRRLLLPNGFFIATVPAFMAAWTNHDALNQHVTRFTKRSLGKLLANSGMEILEQHYFFYWTFFAKFLVRGYERLSTQSPKVPDVPPQWINQSLYLLCRAEQISAGFLPLPFGSSLIAISTNSQEGHVRSNENL